MEIPLHSTSGGIIRQVEVSDYLFGVPFHEAVIHQALVRALANERQGCAATKTRGQIRGSTRKLFRQKGTGRARKGSIKSPVLRGGGVVFGPHPKSYRQKMPKKMRQLALRSVLSAKLHDDEFKIVEELQVDQSKTKNMSNILKALNIDSSVLLVTDGPEDSVIRSARNIEKTRTLPVALLNVKDILSYKFVVMTLAAERRAEQIWSKGSVATED